jgi:DNA polymerase IV
MNTELDKLAVVISNRLQRHQLKGRTVTVKIKFSDFKQITRSQSLMNAVDDLDTIASIARQLLTAADLENKKVRLLGISLSNFGEIVIRDKPDEIQDQLKLF